MIPRPIINPYSRKESGPISIEFHDGLGMEAMSTLAFFQIPNVF